MYNEPSIYNNGDANLEFETIDYTLEINSYWSSKLTVYKNKIYKYSNLYVIEPPLIQGLDDSTLLESASDPWYFDGSKIPIARFKVTEEFKNEPISIGISIVNGIIKIALIETKIVTIGDEKYCYFVFPNGTPINNAYWYNFSQIICFE